MDQHIFSGAVSLIATKDRILNLQAVGLADIANQTPMRTNDIFWIASMSKAITASAMMMLVDEGKVKLDDPVEKYLPEFNGQVVRFAVQPSTQSATAPRSDPNAKVAVSSVGARVPEDHPITIREIMSHTAGLPFSSTIEHGILDTRPLRDAVAQYGRESLILQPGTQYRYANEGLNTAGRIIEVVSGMPYETFLQKRIFDPLGMVDTTFWPTPEQIARIPKSYKSDGHGGLVEIAIDQLTYPLDGHSNRFPMPAGGLFSTAADMMRFCQMLLNDGTFDGKRLLSAEAVHSMATKETPGIVKQPYGFGLSIGPDEFGHGGAYKTDMTVDTKHGLVIIFMVQKADDWPVGDERRIATAIHEKADSMLADQDKP
jgi:CubicO group peptidase (beta-lactamase class C family)